MRQKGGKRLKAIKSIIAFILSLSFIASLFSINLVVSAAGVLMEEDLYYFVNVNSGKYLTLNENHDAVTTNVQIETYEQDAVKHVFKLKDSGNNTYKLQPANSTLRFIGAASTVKSGVNVNLREQSADKSQAFEFYMVSNGIYTIRSATNNNLALTAASKDDKANVNLKTYSATDKNQQWKLVKFSLKKDGDDESIKNYGIDVSYWQDDINWKAVKEYGVEFAIIRIGYSEVKDSKFEEYYKGAKENGIDVGVYIYSYNVSVKEAKRDAADVLKWLNGKELDYPVYYDIEDPEYQGNLSTELRTDMCLAFMKKIKEGGYNTGVYASEDWFTNNLDLEKIRESGSTWLAKWPKSDQADEQHSDYDLWQFRSDGKIAGIKGDVDVNANYGDYNTYRYTGKPITPTNFPVYYGSTKLTLNKDYAISYKNNINAGIATANVSGINDYKDKLYMSYEFRISPVNLVNCEIKEIADRTYSGIKIIPTVNIYYGDKKLKKNVDYTLTGEDNKNAGTGKVIITAKGNFSGSYTKEFTIKKKNVKYADFEGIVNKSYNGKKRTLDDLKVKTSATTLKEGRDYTVSYKNNVNFGEASVTIKGKGDNCKGTITKTFDIVPKKVKNVKASSIKKTSVKLSWDHVDYATRYQIYRATSKNGKYTRIYSTPDRWTYSYTDKTAKEGTYYYYKIRAYKKVNGKKYYGSWSDIISVKTKISNTDFDLKYNQKENSIEVNIEKDKSVTGYIVYLYKSKSKSYEKVWGGKGLQYIKENIDPNKNYSFKIRTYKDANGGRIYGTLSAKKKIKAAELIPAKMDKPKASNKTSSSLKVKWNTLSDATRYQIYRADSKDGKYNRIYTAKNWETYYIDSGLESGKTYYYKIRAYKKIDGTKYYGEWSDILATKTK